MASWRLTALFFTALLAAGAWRGAEAQRRVKLNSIRTLILRGAHSEDLRDAHGEDLSRTRGAHGEEDRAAGQPRANRTRLPSLTGAVGLSKLYQCISDLECSEGSFCHAPSRHAYSRCQSCRRRKRRCQRDAMCCPGNHCSNNMCVPDLDSFLSQRLSEEDDRGAIKKSGGRKAASKQSTIKGQVGGACLRSSDCADGLCCARHFWARICKPVLLEGQVCTRGGGGGGGGGPLHQRIRSKGPGGAPPTGLELFQRCDCAAGLSCRALLMPRAAEETMPSKSSSAPGRLFAPKLYASSSSPSSSSTLLAAASKSLKLASSSSASAAAVLASKASGSRGSSSPVGGGGASPPAMVATGRHHSSAPSRAAVAKGRLHLCTRN